MISHRSDRKPSRPRTVGFTLIELLVVVAVIATLAALLFPVLSSARGRARQAQCASNLKQIGMGLLNYAQDWDETFPYDLYWGPKSNPIPFASYVQNVVGDVWHCPDDPFDTEVDWPDGWPRTSYQESGQFFSGILSEADRDASGSLRTGTTYEPRTLSTVARPSTTIMMDEFHYLSGIGWFPWPGFKGKDEQVFFTMKATWIPGHPRLGWPFHNGRNNYLFADGHVRALRLRETLSPVVLWDTLAVSPQNRGEPGGRRPGL